MEIFYIKTLFSLPLLINLFSFLFIDKINKIILNILILLSSLSYLLIALILISIISINNNEFTFYEFKAFEFVFNFKNFKLSTIFFLLISILYPISLLYGIGYFKKENYKTFLRFSFLSSLSMNFAILMLFSGNFITMFLFYELLTISTAFLIKYKDSILMNKTFISYLKTMIIFSTTFLLFGIIFTEYLTEIDDFNLKNNKIFEKIPFGKMLINIIYFSFVVGIAKIAIFPFHKWIVNASATATPISGMLHAVIVVKAGIILLFKVTFFIFGEKTLSNDIFKIYNYNIFTILSLLSILFASFAALIENNIKKRLAYSTISYLSQMICIISLFNSKTINILTYLIINHSIAKLTIFFACGYISYQTKIKYINEIKKYYINDYLLIRFSLLISAINLTGLPISIGFFIKKSFILFAIEQKLYFIILVFTISSILSILYLFSIIKQINNDKNLQQTEEEKNNYIRMSLILLNIMQISGIIFTFVKNIKHF